MFELAAFKDWHQPMSEEHPKSLADLCAYDCNIPRKDDGFLEKFAIFRCSVEQMLEAKETEKAIGIDIAGHGSGRLAWIPKSVIFDWFPGTRMTPCGLAVKLWYAEKEAQSGGPFFIIPESDQLEFDGDDHAVLLKFMLQIGAIADEEKVTQLLDADKETQTKVWEGIWKEMQIGYKSFEDYWMRNRDDIKMKKTAIALWHIRAILDHSE